MKLTDKQKLSIWKSLKLNEDFFDDVDNHDIINNSVDELIVDPEYTYNIHFIIFINPFLKCIIPKSPFAFMNRPNDEYLYYFEIPKYKPIIESGLLSMKKTLEYVLQATSIVTDYSKPKFYSSYEKIIEEFPFITKNQSNEFKIKANDNKFIILKTSINLSRRKNINKLTKLFYSFCRLQNIYYNLIITKIPNTNLTSQSNVNIGIRVYKNNSYNKSVFYELMPTDMPLDSDGLELINLLNSKDETE